MRILKRFAITAVAAAATTVGLMAPAASQAAVIQLGFILDESGSVGADNWNLVRTGLANAINSFVPTTGEYQISVIKFGATASTVVVPTTITSGAIRTTVANLVANSAYGNQPATNYAVAFDLMRTQLVAGGMGTPGVTFSYVNFATDGEPNAGGDGVTQRNTLITAGVDNISIEGIDVSSTARALLRDRICYPQPCDTTVPYNFPEQGFYVAVDSFRDFEAAIANKIRIVTRQVPEPTSLALLGLGLAGVGFAARRRKALAA